MTITCRHCGRNAPVDNRTTHICPCGKSGWYESGDFVTQRKIAQAQAGGQAFPLQAYEEFNGAEIPGASGMTLRDYFAAKAMQAMITKSSGQDSTGGKDGVPLVSKYAYEYADAMLAERAK